MNNLEYRRLKPLAVCLETTPLSQSLPVRPQSLRQLLWEITWQLNSQDTKQAEPKNCSKPDNFLAAILAEEEWTGKSIEQQ
jgi:hypothetical protein